MGHVSWRRNSSMCNASVVDVVNGRGHAQSEDAQINKTSGTAEERAAGSQALPHRPEVSPANAGGWPARYAKGRTPEKKRERGARSCLSRGRRQNEPWRGHQIYKKLSGGRRIKARPVVAPAAHSIIPLTTARFDFQAPRKGPLARISATAGQFVSANDLPRGS